MMRWSSAMACSFITSFKKLHRKECTLLVISSSSHVADVVAYDICSGLTPQGSCCGTPLDGSTCDPDCVGSLKKVLASWNVSLFFCRLSGVDLVVALRTHSEPVFFSVSSDVPLVEAPLRVTMLTLSSGSFCSTAISWMVWCTAGLGSVILAIKVGHSSCHVPIPQPAKRTRPTQQTQPGKQPMNIIKWNQCWN